MYKSTPEHELHARVQARVGRVHAGRRLGIEKDHEAQVLGQGRTFFHIENWTLAGYIIKFMLHASMLYRAGRRNARAIRITHNVITLPSLPAAFDGYRLLHLSDSHLDMAADMPHALIEAVRSVDYDICVWTGDFRGDTHGPYEAALNALHLVRPHLKQEVYAVLGNHDTLLMLPAMEEMGIRLLMNESIRLEKAGEAIYLAGTDDPHYYRLDNLEKAAQDIPDDAVSILLTHSPEIYKHAAHAGFKLMLCGHTHGGQICLPGRIPLLLNAKCPRRFATGSWTFHQLQGYTSRGSGACVVDVRFNCPPEVTLHCLRKGEITD